MLRLLSEMDFQFRTWSWSLRGRGWPAGRSLTPSRTRGLEAVLFYWNFEVLPPPAPGSGKQMNKFHETRFNSTLCKRHASNFPFRTTTATGATFGYIVQNLSLFLDRFRPGIMISIRRHPLNAWLGVHCLYFSKKQTWNFLGEWKERTETSTTPLWPSPLCFAPCRTYSKSFAGKSKKRSNLCQLQNVVFVLVVNSEKKLNDILELDIGRKRTNDVTKVKLLSLEISQQKRKRWRRRIQFWTTRV